MDLLKFFIKDDVPAVGLNCFRDTKEDYSYIPRETYNYNKQIFTPNYTKNFFLL
ncbi:hypothetical protein IJ579_04985 [bacterium]|nr:hypothetical protein [bacterium]